MNQINYVSEPSSKPSLINSRKRMHCEPSNNESSSDLNTLDALKEFEREIEQRYKLSICNKIYTFPRHLNSFAELLSSSEEEEGNFPKQTITFIPKKTDKTFKKTNLRLKTISNHKQSSREKTNEKNGNKKESIRKIKVVQKSKEKAEQKSIEKERAKRLRTQPESANSFMETIRSKIVGKKTLRT